MIFGLEKANSGNPASPSQHFLDIVRAFSQRVAFQRRTAKATWHNYMQGLLYAQELCNNLHTVPKKISCIFYTKMDLNLSANGKKIAKKLFFGGP